MNENEKELTTKDIRSASLEKYSSKHEVTKKWISLNKKLNPNRGNVEYGRLIIEAISVLEYVIENKLQEDLNGKEKFPEKINKLKKKGYSIEDNEFSRLMKIKWYRNIGAHNTETTLQEVVSYDIAKDAFLDIGAFFNKLGMLEKDDINPSFEKLHANVGEVIGETCLLQDFIGGGGSGRVFKAHHQRLDLTVAVKEIRHDIIENIDVANEKNMLLSLRHEGIPRIYDVIQDNQTYYLIMDYILGQTLEESVKSMGPLPVTGVKKVGLQLCNIISYLHNFSGGIIYKDLKPSNIMIDLQNHIHLIDFGISERADNKTEDQKVYAATMQYASPEQLKGETCDKRSDIYSLGATLYFLTEGQHPNTDGELRFKRSTPEKLINIIEKAMAFNKKDRYETVEQMAKALQDYNAEFKTEEAFDTVIKPVKKAPNKTITATIDMKKGIIAAIVIAALILGAAALKTILSSNTKKPDGTTNIQTTTGSDNKAASDTGKNNSTQQNTNQAPQNNASTPVPSNSEVSVGKAATAFDGKASLTVSSYFVDGDNLIVKGTIENNYGKQFNISLYDIYVMGDNGSKFALDMQQMLSSGANNYEIASGEKAPFKFIFKNYKESNVLTLKVSQIFCFGGSNNEKFTLQIK